MAQSTNDLTMRRLEEQLAAAEQRIREAEQRAREAEQREGRERQLKEETTRSLNQTTQSLNQATQSLSQETQQLTLFEYLRSCHDQLYTKLRVERNPENTTQGEVTSPTGRKRPNLLEPWPDMLELQRNCLYELDQILPFHSCRIFRREQSLIDQGGDLRRKMLGSEQDLDKFHLIAVEHPLLDILDAARTTGSWSPSGSGQARFSFANHPNAIGENWSVAPQGASQILLDSSPSRAKKVYADQMLITSVTQDGQRLMTPVLCIEYKAPHKITPEQFRVSLADRFNLNDFLADPYLPDKEDHQACFKFHACKLVASAITQTYDYMIRAGLEYGLVTTGEVYVFLRARWDSEGVVEFHVAEPKVEYDEQVPDDQPYCTAVSQLLAFCLLAAKRQPHGFGEREAMMSRLHEWNEDPEAILRNMSSSEREPSPSSDEGYPSPKSYKGINRSPHQTRSRGAHAVTPSRHVKPGRPRDDSSPSPPSSPTSKLQTSSTGPSKRARGGSHSRGTPSRHTPSEARDIYKRAFCTQACLLGLQRGTQLDLSCENVGEHRRGDSNASGVVMHPINSNALREALVQQLRKDQVNCGFTELHMGGATGVLFKVALWEYGYTFVAKATKRNLIQRLQHEEQIYTHLTHLQGQWTAVCLGSIELPIPISYYRNDVWLVHALLLSWSGMPANRTSVNMKLLVKDTKRRLQNMGIQHNDWRTANVLHCEETKTCVAIDFDRATVEVPVHNQILRIQKSNSKRKRSSTGRTLGVDDESSSKKAKTDFESPLRASRAPLKLRE